MTDDRKSIKLPPGVYEQFERARREVAPDDTQGEFVGRLLNETRIERPPTGADLKEAVREVVHEELAPR